MEKQIVLTNRSKIKYMQIDIKMIAFFLLCCYVALNTLAYMSFIPLTLVSLALYSFIAISCVVIMSVQKIKVNTYVWAYAGFALLCFISSLYSKYFNASFATTIEVLKILIFILMIVNIVDSIKKIEIILSIYSYCTVFLTIYLAMTDQLFVEERLGDTLTGNANTLASIFMLSALSSIYFIFNSPNKKRRLLAYICFFAQEFTLFLTGSRKAALMPLLLFCVLMMFKMDKKGRKHVFRNGIIAVLIVVGVLTAVFEIPFLYDAIGYRMEGLLNFVSGEGQVDASTVVRANMIEEAISRWKEKPILGHGIDTYKKMSHYGCYSHNNFVELLCDVGIIGFIIYYFSYVFLVVKAFSKKTLGITRWYWVFFLIIVCFYEYGGVTYYMFSFQIFFTLMCIFLQLSDKNSIKR